MGGPVQETRIGDSWMGLIVGIGSCERLPVGTVVMVSWMGLIVGIGISKRLPVGTVVMWTFGYAEVGRRRCGADQD